MTQGFVDRARSASGGLLGTWVKIPAFETVEMLAHAGFDFVVLDMEHSPLSLDRTYELIFAAQRMGMAALVRLPDHLGTAVQPLLDAGADGLLVPRVTSPETAAAIAARMVFAPAGERGLGFTSRAGRWSMMPLPDYLRRGDEQCLRMIQLEDWASLEAVGRFASLSQVNGLFVGTGDLFLSSGKPAGSPEVQALLRQVLEATGAAGKLSGVAASTPAEAQTYLAMGFSLVMVSNDATLFGRAAAEIVRASRESAR
jgi:2-dehydro-3-deoxyglucarate aldolase/4-hydroxy-2-oxoheptanedioate aldolase